MGTVRKLTVDPGVSFCVPLPATGMQTLSAVPHPTATVTVSRTALEYLISAVEKDLKRHGKKLDEEPAVHAAAIAALAEAHERLLEAFAQNNGHVQ